MYITNVHLCTNTNAKLKPNVIYATLRHSDGDLIISATLDYILLAIMERNYLAENVTITTNLRGDKEVNLIGVFT